MQVRQPLFALAAFAALVPAQIPGGPNGPATVVWSVASGGNGHAYEAVAVPGGVTWFDAQAAAVAAGGYLATPSTLAENTFVFGLINAPQYWSSSAGFGQGPWLGGFFSLIGFSYQFVVSTDPFPSGVAPWAPSQPDFSGGATRLHYTSSSPGVRTDLWDDAVPTDPVIAYVVEYDLSLPCPAPASGAFSLCVAYDAASAAGRLQLFNVPSPILSGRVLLSTTLPPVLGTGSFFGLTPDALVFAILFQPPAAGSPFSWVFGDPGEYPATPYFFQPGYLAFLAGATLDVVAATIDPSGGVSLSNFTRITF